MNYTLQVENQAKALRDRAERLGTAEAWLAWELTDAAARNLRDAKLHVDADEPKIINWKVTVRVATDHEIVVQAPANDGKAAMKVAEDRMKAGYPHAHSVESQIANKL